MMGKEKIARVKDVCDGMLPLAVYELLYKHASDDVRNIIEVGTAHGAATIALAMGLKDSGERGHIYTFEKLSMLEKKNWFPAGTFRKYVGERGNEIETIHRNLDQFGVGDLVTVLVGDVIERHVEIPQNFKIDLLMLDADGAIDRDFILFFDRIKPAGIICIDDVKDIVRVSRINASTILVDQKHRITQLLLSVLIKNNFLEPICQINDTWFGRKLKGHAADLPLHEFLNAYRNLVFAKTCFSDQVCASRTSAGKCVMMLKHRVGQMLRKCRNVSRYRFLS